MNKIKKLKHQAPKKYQPKRFNFIRIKGDYDYCWSHHFIFNNVDQEKLLYNGKPCIYTDNRFKIGLSYYKEAYIYQRRNETISFKSAIRRINRLKGVPKGLIFYLETKFYYPNKKFTPSYLHKVKKEQPLEIEYQINNPNYYSNFTSCEYSQELTEALRKSGFIVKVYRKNDNYLSSMVAMAASLKGKHIETKIEEGEYAIAYGHGKIIGYSSYRNTLKGYSNGIENILWDAHGYFNKWSRCCEIPKSTSINDVLKILLKNNELFED